MNAKAKRHVGKVVALGCVVCRNLGYGATPAIAHHPRGAMFESGGAMKCSDFFVIPLCPPHHAGSGAGVSYHDAPEQWERLYGTQVMLLAQTLEDLQ